MFKKLVKGIIIGGAALTLSMAAAQAGTIEVNIYGASAQFNYWVKTAPAFMVNGLNCKEGDVYAAYSKKLVKDHFSSRDAGVAVCAGDTSAFDKMGDGVGGNESFDEAIDGSTVVIRYTTNASYDGIRAVMGDTTRPNADATYLDENEEEQPLCDSAELRGQALSATLIGYANYSDTNKGSINSLSCLPVNVGASDVAAKTFNQESHGNSHGPLFPEGSEWMDMRVKYSKGDVKDPQLFGYQYDRPIVVPFGFYRNNAVPFTNMSRLMATSIFSGQVTNWKEFDPTLDPLPMVVCLRHAGSGTAATLDAAVMRKDAVLPIDEVDSNNGDFIAGISPLIFFNKGTSEELACVDSAAGAVGYADADQAETATHKRMTYMGVMPSSSVVKNGQYDFWSAQWLYSNQSGNTDTIIDALVGFASDETNMNASQKLFWAAQNAMKWEKNTDFKYPTKKVLEE